VYNAVAAAFLSYTQASSSQQPYKELDARDDITAIRRWSGNCEFIYQP
jgi:hypothetical protein